MKRGTDGLIDLSGELESLDPAIASTISRGRIQSQSQSQSQPKAKRTAAQRKKALKDQDRNRLTFDCAPELEERLRVLAGELSVPYSSLIVYLIDRALDLVSMEEIQEARISSRSMRYEYVIPFQGNRRNGYSAGAKRKR